ncbi:MAG TPA: hypothetical protein VF062_04780 [Candidatus Limnocylindrales bacterium]
MTYQPPLPPPPPPPAKPRNNARTIIIVIAVVVVLCCIGGIIGGIVFFRTVQTQTGPAEAAATAYVDDIMAERYSAAYGRLCGKLKGRLAEAEYTRVQSAQMKISSYEIVGTSVTTRNTTVTATVSMRMVQAETGAEFTQGIFLLKEGGQWRPCE